MTTQAASKFLAQKWEAEKYRIHRNRVHNSVTHIDNSKPREFPHLKLALNRIAIEEDKQARYEKENQILLNKIRIIVKGKGNLDNWNSWTKKNLHAEARQRKQKEIELANRAMLNRLLRAKPVVRRDNQVKEYKKHKQYQGLLDGSIKDFKSPRAQKSVTPEPQKKTTHKKESVKEDVEADTPFEKEEDETTPTDQSEHEEQTTPTKSEDNSTLPPLPANKKPKNKSTKPPPENKKKNRNAGVPKLPAI